MPVVPREVPESIFGHEMFTAIHRCFREHGSF